MTDRDIAHLPSQQPIPNTKADRQTLERRSRILHAQLNSMDERWEANEFTLVRHQLDLIEAQAQNMLADELDAIVVV